MGPQWDRGFSSSRLCKWSEKKIAVEQIPLFFSLHMETQQLGLLSFSTLEQLLN